MSIEYTIDIQLTELGFPDILQPQDTSVIETTSSTDSFSHCPTSRPTPRKRRREIRDGKEADAAKHSSNTESTTAGSLPSPPPETTPCQRLDPSPRPRDEQRVNGAAESSTVGGPAVEEPTAEAETTDGPQRPEGDGGKAEVDSAKVSTKVLKDVEEEDSDDSDVSDVYEEEEVDEEEDDEEEEGPNNEPGDFHCSVCDLLLSSKFKLQDHMNLHTGARPYCCAECGKRFCQIYNYRVHLRTHAQAKVERLVCRICLRGFASQEDLDKHLSKTHFEDVFYECDLCKRVFTSLKECQYHVQTHKCMLNVVCDRCGRNFSSAKSLARHRKKTCHCHFKCTDCTKTFTKKNALLKHSFSHLGLLPYTCIRCRCHFRLARLYRKHKCEPERIHCVACLREFLSQEDFQQHKKDTGCWGNQEPNETADEIRCLECGERFDSSDELKKHAGAHQRVLKCAECGKGFRSALLLMSHMGGHAGKSPCLCQSCGLGFPHQQNYDSHLKICGQKPRPATAPKKRPTLKIPPPVTKKLCTKPDSSNAARKVIKPAAAAAVNTPSAPVKDSSSSRLVTEGASAGSGPSDGLWRLTLNKEPPPGVKLVVFLPVCPSQANGLPLPSAVPQTLPVSAMQALPHLAPSSGLSNGHLGVNAALGLPLNAPMDLLTGIKQHSEAPLDLSKKTNTSKPAVTNIPSLPIKSEPDELEISGQRNRTEGQEPKNHDSKVIVQTVTEPSCPKFNCRPEKEIKMEVSNPACAQTGK